VEEAQRSSSVLHNSRLLPFDFQMLLLLQLHRRWICKFDAGSRYEDTLSRRLTQQIARGSDGK